MEQQYDELVKKLERMIEVADNMEKKLDSILLMIEKAKNPIVTNVNDGEIMFRHKKDKS